MMMFFFLFKTCNSDCRGQRGRLADEQIDVFVSPYFIVDFGRTDDSHISAGRLGYPVDSRGRSHALCAPQLGLGLAKMDVRRGFLGFIFKSTQICLPACD